MDDMKFLKQGFNINQTDQDVTKYLISKKPSRTREKTDDRTALHSTGQNGHLDVTKCLISQGAEVNNGNNGGMTALHLAAHYGLLDVTSYLISEGADVNNGKNDRWTALHSTAQTGHLEFNKYLMSQKDRLEGGKTYHPCEIERRKNISKIKRCAFLYSLTAEANKRKNDDWTVLHSAAQNGHLDVTKYLISEGAEVNKGDEDGSTALHLAAQNGHLDVTEYLITNQESAAIKEETEGWIALLLAARSGHLGVPKYPIRQRVDVNKGKNDSCTALHLAAQNGHLDVTKYLISKGAEVNKGDEDGSTALHLAAQNGHLDVTKYMISHGAEVNKGNTDGSTALHNAAHNGHLDVIKYLISKGSDVNKGKNYGLTALHIAVKNCHLNVIRCLISQGAQLNDATNEGMTALHLAAKKGHPDICTYLLGHGADVTKVDNEGWTPLHDAVQECHLEVVKVLFSGGARADIKDVHGQTPLQLSLMLGNQSIVDIFNGCSCSTSEETNSADVLLATEKGLTSTIEKIVSLYGADLNVQSPDGQTCLHKAITLCYKTERNVKETDTLRKISEDVYQGELSPEKALVFYLLENGAKFDVRDKHGNLPIHYAQDEVVKQMILSRLPSLDVIQSYRADPKALPIVTSVEIRDTITQHTQLEDHGVSISIPPETFQRSDLTGCKITLTLLRDPPSVDIQDDESMACYGIRCDTPLDSLEDDNIIFHQPVKIEIPHSTLISNPNQVTPDIVSHVWDATKDLPITSRKRSSASPKEPPYCRVHERHLELYIDRFADWWVLIPLEQQVIRHHLLCTPYIPDTIDRGKEIKVHFHVHANVPGMDIEVENEEKGKSYHKAHRPVPFSIVSHSGDVTVGHECDKEVAVTKLSLRDIHSQMSHHVVLAVPSPQRELGTPFRVITITVTQEGERGISRSMAFVIRYEDEMKRPKFSPIMRNIEVSTDDLSEHDVIRMADNLSIDDFYDLGVALGFPIAKLDAIEYKRLNDRQQAICDMLMQWKQSQPSGQNLKKRLLSIVKSAEAEEELKMTDFDFPGEISDHTLLKLARHIKAAEFIEIGTKLGFSRTKLDNIKHRALLNRKEANIQMLSMWKASQISVATATETLKCIWKSVSSASRTEPDEILQVPYPQTSVKRVEPSEPVEPEDMDIIAYADTDEKSWNVDQCGSIPSTEELCSVALPVKSFSLVLALEKALRLNDDVMVGLIDLPISSALQKIARQVIDSWRKGLRDKEREDRFAQLLSKYKIQDVKEGSEGISKRIQSKTDLLELCGYLNMGSSDILQFLSTSLTFPSHMIRRNTIKMLGEWVRQGGTRERLLEITQAFRFNDAAAEVAEVMKTNPGCTSLFSHTTVDHKGGELSLQELGITVSIPEGAIPKGMGSVVTLQVRSQDTPRIPLQDGELLISPVVECSLTQELLKPATVALPHCTNRRDLGDGSTVMLYTKIGPGTFGRRKLSSSTSRGFHISKETIKFRTRHLQVWALSTASVIGVHLSCATFQPILIASAEKPSLRVYVVHSIQYYAEVIKKKEKTSSVPYCQVTDEFKFSIDLKAGDLKILCNDGSKKTTRMVPIKSLRNGKCKPLDFELQFSPEETGKKTIHLTILQGSSMRADKELTISLEVEPAYGVDITDPQGRLQYVSDNLLEILSEVIHTPRDTQSLGYHLGFSHSTVDRYLDRADSSLNHVSKSGFCEMLRDWRRQVRPSEQVDELHLAMKNAELGHAADVIMQELSTTSRRHFAQIRQEWEARK